MINNISDKQMAGITAGSALIGTGAGYMFHRSYAKSCNQLTKDTIAELDTLEKNTIFEKETDIRKQCLDHPNYSKKIKNLLSSSGKTSVFDLSLKDILTPEDYSEYSKNKEEVIAKSIATKNRVIEECKTDIKHNKIKNIVVGALVGTTISLILPVAKYFIRKKNENSTNNKVQQ